MGGWTASCAWVCSWSLSPPPAGCDRDDGATSLQSECQCIGWLPEGCTSPLYLSRQAAGSGRYVAPEDEISPARTIGRPHDIVSHGSSIDRYRMGTPAVACSPILALPLLHVSP